MKAVCISACEVERLGIVTPGEEVELPDALAKDRRINQHFVIDRQSIVDKRAKLPDYARSDRERRERFERSLLNETEWMKAINLVIDSGRDVPPEILESGRLANDERISRLVNLWIEDFGNVFPTDQMDPGGNSQVDNPSGAKTDRKETPGEGKAGNGAEDDLFGEK